MEQPMIEIDGNLVPVFYSESGKYYYIYKTMGEGGKYPVMIDYHRSNDELSTENTNIE